jgi:hypothetical protein
MSIARNLPSDPASGAPRRGNRASRLILVLALAAAAAPAAATHVVYHTWGPASAHCSVPLIGPPPLLDTCVLTIRQHFEWSDPAIHCRGSEGAYTDCDVYNECQWEVSGIVLTAVITCDGDTPKVWTGTGFDRGLLGGDVTIPRGRCEWLDFDIQGHALLVTLGAIHHAFRVCVDAWGPYEG